MMSDRRPWRPCDGALLAGLAILAVAATLSVWGEVFRTAVEQDEQSHILLALPIAAWLGWVRRARWRRCRPRWSLSGPALIALGWAGAWAGFTQGIDAARHFGALLVVVGAVVTITGPRILREFSPSVIALLFLMPIPASVRHEIAIPLQNVSATAAGFCLELFGVPVARSGNVLTVNGQEVAVAEACNGMRMVAALGLVSFAFVFTVPMRPGVRVLLLAASPAVAVVVNVLRLVPTVLLYGYADAAVADAFHDISGWVMLFVALGMLWGLLVLLRWIEVPVMPYPVVEA